MLWKKIISNHMTWTITIKVPWMWLTSPKCEWTTRHLSFFFFFPSKICLTFETFVFSYKVLHLNSTLWGVFEHFLDTLLSHSITYYSKHNIHSLGWSTFFKNYRTFLHSIYEKFVTFCHYERNETWFENEFS